MNIVATSTLDNHFCETVLTFLVLRKRKDPLSLTLFNHFDSMYNIKRYESLKAKPLENLIPRYKRLPQVLQNQAMIIMYTIYIVIDFLTRYNGRSCQTKNRSGTFSNFPRSIMFVRKYWLYYANLLISLSFINVSIGSRILVKTLINDGNIHASPEIYALKLPNGRYQKEITSI